MGVPASKRGFARKADEGEDLWILEGLYSFMGRSDETAAYLACQVQGPEGFAIPVHFHDDEEEAFYVAQGEATIFLGDEVRRLGPGGFALAPRGERHAFRLETPDAVLLVLVSPGVKHEAMFREMGTQAGEHRLPPAPGPVDPGQLAEIAARHGTHIVGPPPER